MTPTEQAILNLGRFAAEYDVDAARAGEGTWERHNLLWLAAEYREQQRVILRGLQGHAAERGSAQ